MEIMGTLSSGRPGGNPELTIYQFRSDRSEALTERISIRISPSMAKFLREMKDYPEYVRQAILEKIEREGGETPHQQD